MGMLGFVESIGLPYGKQATLPQPNLRASDRAGLDAESTQLGKVSVGSSLCVPLTEYKGALT